jgi:hypothetical protein
MQSFVVGLSSSCCLLPVHRGPSDPCLLVSHTNQQTAERLVLQQQHEECGIEVSDYNPGGNDDLSSAHRSSYAMKPSIHAIYTETLLDRYYTATMIKIYVFIITWQLYASMALATYNIYMAICWRYCQQHLYRARHDGAIILPIFSCCNRSAQATHNGTARTAV